MTLPSNRLVFFAGFIEKELGIIYSDSNYFQLQNRLEEMTKILGFQNVDELWEKAQYGITGNMRQLLLDLATNNETSFFRDAKIFRAIESAVLAGWMERKTSEPLQVWSAASSFGQEPYTLAMLFKQFQETHPLFRAEILATDIADRALVRAQAGKYTQLEVQRGLSAALMVKCFDKVSDNEWQIKPEFRRMVRFKKQNLLEPFSALGRFDLVLCRNVLIYQRVENKIKVIDKIADLLNPGGVLVLGAGESLIGITDKFEQVHCESVVLYRLKSQEKRQAA